MNLFYFALCIGLVSVALNGFLCFPDGAGTSLSQFLMLLLILQHARTRGITFSLRERWEMLLGFGFALIPFLRSDGLVLIVGACGYFFTLGIFLLRINSEQALQWSPAALLLSLGEYLGSVLSNVFRAPRLIRQVRREGKKGEILQGALLSIVPLVIFNWFFERVNLNYAHAVQSMLSFVFNIEFIKILLFGSLQGLLIHLFFSARYSAKPIPALGEDELRSGRTHMLIPIIALMGLFSLFQVFEAGNISSALEFKRFSLYVQKGFWELLSASLLGACIWLYVRYKGADISKLWNKKRLLSIFILILLGLCLFTAHKLGLLQISYGLKDQRSYASALLLIICLGFAYALSVLLFNSDLCLRFRALVTQGLSLICLLGLLNLESLQTKIRPISFYVENNKFKDMAYLLTNSYDNVSDWEGLISESLGVGLPRMENYYWGDFKPLCIPSLNGSLRFPFIERNSDLIDSYSKANFSLRDIGRFNLAEFQAFKWLLSHDQLVREFNILVEKSC